MSVFLQLVCFINECIGDMWFLKCLKGRELKMKKKCASNVSCMYEIL